MSFLDRFRAGEDPQEPASPPPPERFSVEVPNDIPPTTMEVLRDVQLLQEQYQERSRNVGPDRERLPVTPMTLADVYNPYSISAQVEEDLAAWTEEQES
jgi:hypothetical protein